MIFKNSIQIQISFTFSDLTTAHNCDYKYSHILWALCSGHDICLIIIHYCSLFSHRFPILSRCPLPCPLPHNYVFHDNVNLYLVPRVGMVGSVHLSCHWLVQKYSCDPTLIHETWRQVSWIASTKTLLSIFYEKGTRKNIFPLAYGHYLV